MNDEPTCPFALVPGQILLANFEDLYVVRYDTHYEGHIWIRVYNKGGYLRNSLTDTGWIWKDPVPEPVKQFAENYARLIS